MQRAKHANICDDNGFGLQRTFADIQSGNGIWNLN